MHLSHQRYSGIFFAVSNTRLGKRFIAGVENDTTMASLLFVGLLVIFFGVLAMLIGLLPTGKGDQSEAKFGGVVMIGPVPIIFGSNTKWASIAIALAIVLLALGLLYYVI